MHFLTPVGSVNQRMKACSQSRAGSAKTWNYFLWSINNILSYEAILLSDEATLLRKVIDWSLTNENSSVFLPSLHVTKNRLSFAGSQTLLASESEFNSRGNFNSKETVRDTRRLLF